MFWTQFSFPFVFQGDLWWRPRWHVYFFVHDFSRFHPNNFRNTISWKCFLKDDSIRSSLIEFQSFLNGKIDVDPTYCVLMSFSCFMHVLCTTRYTQVDYIRTLVIFCPWDPQAERTLSVFCSNFDLQVLIPNWWQNANWPHIPHDKCTGSCSEWSHCPVTKDPYNCVPNVLEELGNTQLVMKNQYSTGIFSFFLLLLPSTLSTCYRTNEENAGMFLKSFFFSTELNCSIFFSMDLLWMTKMIHYFLR